MSAPTKQSAAGGRRSENYNTKQASTKHNANVPATQTAASNRRRAAQYVKPYVVEHQRHDGRWRVYQAYASP